MVWIRQRDVLILGRIVLRATMKRSNTRKCCPMGVVDCRMVSVVTVLLLQVVYCEKTH